MVTVEKCHCIALHYNWKFANCRRDVVFLSNKIKYQENYSFRVGFKNMSPYKRPTLFFVTTNLNKIGLAVNCILFSSGSDSKKTAMVLNTSNVKGEENGEIQYVCRRYPTVWALLVKRFTPKRLKFLFQKTKCC